MLNKPISENVFFFVSDINFVQLISIYRSLLLDLFEILLVDLGVFVVQKKNDVNKIKCYNVCNSMRRDSYVYDDLLFAYNMSAKYISRATICC